MNLNEVILSPFLGIWDNGISIKEWIEYLYVSRGLTLRMEKPNPLSQGLWLRLDEELS